jgi:hypothetical protein
MSWRGSSINALSVVMAGSAGAESAWLRNMTGGSREADGSGILGFPSPQYGKG